MNRAIKTSQPAIHDQPLFVAHPYALNGANIGGLASVIDAELKGGSGDLRGVTFITSDDISGVIRGVNVQHALPEEGPMKGMPMSRRLWDVWCTLHHESYTDLGCPPEALARMYQGNYLAQSGSLGRLHEHCERYAPSVEAERAFHERYRDRFNNLSPGSVLNLQDFLWFGALREYGPQLKAQGVTLVSYLHTSLPDNLLMSERGRGILRAISAADQFYAHTDLFLERAKQQLLEIGLPVPELKRMDLGIDRSLLDEGLRKVSAANFVDTIPGFAQLPMQQQEFLSNLYHSKRTVPHTFVCIDRIDPIKGLDTLLDDIEMFLLTEKARGMSNDELSLNYRFFFVNLRMDPSQADSFNLSHQYGLWLDEKFDALLEKFPGVIHRGSPITGRQRVAMASILRGSHVVSGGRGEGLHLSFMEALYANQGLPYGGVLGRGAGFAQHAVVRGFDDPVYFPQQNDPHAFRNSIEQLVKYRNYQPNVIVDRTGDIVEKVINPRQHSVIFGS